MPTTFKKNRAVLSDVAAVDDAENLLEWLQKHPKGEIDLSECTHLHPANLQVLMAANRSRIVPPKDNLLAVWLDSALKSK